MPQPDLVAALRAARPVAPAEVRERVRAIAAAAGPEPRRHLAWRQLSWRKGLAVAAPLVAAAAVAAVVLPGGGRQQPAPVRSLAPAPVEKTPSFAAGGAATQNLTAGSGSSDRAAALPLTSPSRVQRVTASLELRVRSADDISDGTKRAVRIARSLGGYASRLQVDTSGATGSASLTLRIPKESLQTAVTRLAALGTIVGENVRIQDLQNQIDATARKLARLRAKLAAWQAQPQTDETQRHIASLTDQIAKLTRGRNATIRSAKLATLDLALSTRPGAVPVTHSAGNFHGLRVAFRWIGVGAVYALALGGPAVALLALCWLAARAVRRRREDALLSRP